MFKRFLQFAAAQTALAGAAASYLKFVAKTTRWQVEGQSQLAEFAQGAACIVAFWHETLPSMPVFWLRAQTPRLAVVLASRHRDGQLISKGVNNFGIGTVSGSSSRGGATGLRALITALQNGNHVGITPDGPRGPRRIAAPGTAQLAALSGAKILPCAAYIKWAIPFKSWDQMRFPLPFGRGRLVCAPFITVERENWTACLPIIEAALTAAITTAERGA